ncbi:hypothetical protein PSEUDO9AZ_20387 [Pseudomonas sp. 9AZ]|nr:hypothetical protein PSEUDO9AZ_20387 [Pseudomonas sp. 9AZ]
MRSKTPPLKSNFQRFLTTPRLDGALSFLQAAFGTFRLTGVSQWVCEMGVVLRLCTFLKLAVTD